MNMITNGDTVCELDYDGMEVLSALSVLVRIWKLLKGRRKRGRPDQSCDDKGNF